MGRPQPQLRGLWGNGCSTSRRATHKRLARTTTIPKVPRTRAVPFLADGRPMRPVAAHVRPRPLKSHPIAVRHAPTSVRAAGRSRMQDAGGRAQKHQQIPLNHPNAPQDLPEPGKNTERAPGCVWTSKPVSQSRNKPDTKLARNATPKRRHTGHLGSKIAAYSPTARNAYKIHVAYRVNPKTTPKPSQTNVAQKQLGT